jgi:hypothetical protein
MKCSLVTVRDLLALLLLTFLSAAVGCALVASPLEHGQKTINVAHVSGKPLDVQTSNGAIVVTRSDRPDVEIVAEIAATTPERLAAAKILAARNDGGALVVRCDWPDGQPLDAEGCSFTVNLPDATDLTLLTDNGNLQATDFAGSAKLQTTNGKITVDRQAGDVDANTQNGQIKISEAGGAVKAGTTNGAIDIALSAASTGPVEASGVNAVINLAIGPAFTGQLSLSTVNGSVQVDSSVKARSESTGMNELQLSFAEAGVKSTASTVNGAVNVRMLESAAASGN